MIEKEPAMTNHWPQPQKAESHTRINQEDIGYG